MHEKIIFAKLLTFSCSWINTRLYLMYVCINYFLYKNTHMKKQKIDVTIPTYQYRHIDTYGSQVFIFLRVLKFLFFFYNFHKFFYHLAFYVLYTYLQIQHTQQRHFNLFQYHYYREVELFFVNFFSFFFFFFLFFLFT
jgi:hypothetical protein